MNKTYLFLLMTVFIVQTASAQYFIWGTEPNLKWKMRSTPHLNLISPNSFKADSLFVPYFDSAIVYQTHLLQTHARKLNIVLHPNTLISNGFVAWAPARSELFTVPARDFYPGFWPQQLAWHEMRHLAQYSVAHELLKKRIGWVFGEYLTVGMMGIVVPPWYIEGDATASETAFLNTGRGRSPSFSTPYFAWLNARKKNPDYDRCVLGSDNHYTPDRYLYGYWMVAAGQKSFGAQFWPKVYAETFMKNNFGMFPRSFKQNVPDHTPLRTFHDSTQVWMLNSINAELSATPLTTTIPITESRDYRHYRPIGCDSAGNVVAFSQSIHGEPCFVITGKNRRDIVIKNTNYIHDDAFGFDGRYIYYSEYRPHERWEMVDFSRTLRLDITSGKVENISVTFKELLPAVSPDGQILATCAYRNDGTYMISVTDLKSSQTLGWAEFPYIEQPLSMAVDNAAKNLYIIQQTVSQRRIIKFGGTTKTAQVLLSSTDKNFSNLTLIGDHLYFNSTMNGNEEIWRISVAGGNPECITNTAFGAAFPVSDGKTGLYFSEMTAHGYQIRHISQITPAEPVSRWEFMYEMADSLSMQTKTLCDSINTTNAEISDAKPYSKDKHLINIHSWGPLSIDPSAGTINPGIQFDSQNMLSTLAGSVFSGYNLSTATIESGVRASYYGWYPVLTLGYTNYLPFVDGAVNYSYNDLNLSASLPLTYSKNAWSFHITPQLETRPWCAIDTGDGMMGYSRYAGFLSLSAYKYTNNRNLYPKLGAFFGGGALWQDFDNHQGTLLAGIGGMWLPGVFRHDGFRIRGGYELRDTLALPFSTMMSAPRCFNLIENPVQSFVSAEYACPLLYPDIHMGSLFYLKRITGMVSYDYAWSPDNKEFSSAGFHLMTDVHFLRLYTPIRLVFSEYYLQPTNEWQFQFGLSYDLYAY